MKNSGLALLVLLAVTSPCMAQLSIDTLDVGEIYQANLGKSVILVTNIGDKPVHLLAVTAAYDQDKVGDFPKVVAPKTSVNIPVEVFSGMDAGDHRHIFNIDTDSPKRPKLQVLVHLFGLSVLDDAGPKVNLGTIDTDKTPAAKTIALSSREVPGFHIERVIAVPDFVTAKILPDGHTLEIAGNTVAPWGLQTGYVKLKLNSTVQPEAWIQVTADVHGDVVPSQNPIELGVIQNSAILPVVVQFKSRDGKPVHLGAIAVNGIKAKVSKDICVGDPKGCAQVSVTLDDTQPGGRVDGNLLVDLPDFHRQLSIDMGGLYFPKGTQIHSLNEAVDKAKSKASTQSAPLNLKEALQRSTEPATKPPLADPPGTGPLLKWQTSSESLVYGYLIYRSDAENGQYLRVNKDIVRVTSDGSPGEVSTYAWRDSSATPGKTYWYYIGLINKDGTKQQLSGPQKVVAK